MGSRRVSSLVLFLFFTFCVVSWKFSLLSVKDAGRLVGRVLLLLSVLMWTGSYFYTKLKSYMSPSGSVIYGPAEDADNFHRQESARREQQLQHSVKSDAFLEAVVKPRHEAGLKKKETDFYRMTGQSWKLSHGVPLGGDGEMKTEDDQDTPNQRAARTRRELQTQRHAPVQTELPKGKKIIVLPEEPEDEADGVVKISLRCPSGRTVRRTFLKAYSSTVLLDWLHKSGYSPVLYGLYSSYPRRPLLIHKDLSIEAVGIDTHTTLNVEERDPSTT